MSRTRRNELVPAHLIVGNSLSKSFNEPHDLSGIPALIYEPGLSATFQHFLRTLLDFLQCATRDVDKEGGDKQSASVPGQLFASLRLLRVSVDRRRSNGLLEPVQLGSKVFDILLNIVAVLRESMSACATVTIPTLRQIGSHLAQF